MQPTDKFLEFQDRYGGQYVAERDGIVVTHAKTYQEVREQVGKLGLGERGNVTYRFIHPRRREN